MGSSHWHFQYMYPSHHSYLVSALEFFSTTTVVMVCGLDRISYIAVQALASSNCSRNYHVGSDHAGALVDLDRRNEVRRLDGLGMVRHAIRIPWKAEVLVSCIFSF
jgi:hypothetical protein